MIFTAMRKTKNLFILSSLLVLVLGISSCSDFDNGYTSKDIAYKEQFYNMFGNADPNHTWNMAEVCSLDVTIHMEGTYTVKVWTANPRSSENNAYLLGQYDNVAGGTSNIFGCDIPSTVEVAYVGIISENGDRIIEPATVKDGKASVSFGVKGTRAVLGGDGVIEVSAVPQNDRKIFGRSDIEVPLATLPEGQGNIGKVAQNFEYESTGEFVIYPLYSITGNRGSTGNGERLGIYLCNEDGPVRDSEGNIVVTWIWQATTAKDGQTAWFEAYNSQTGEFMYVDAFCKSNINTWNGYVDGYDDNSTLLWDEGDPWVAGDEQFFSPYDGFRPEGIKVNIPAGTRFGMVLDATGGGPYYSNSQYNNDEGWPFQGQESGNTDEVNDVYGASFKRGNDLYLAFEDWNYSDTNHDCDFNDIVFVIPEGAKPIIIDKESEDVSMLYIVACEDLGGTFDWDFNDVVYGIEHVSGQETARLKLLAAGGTLPVKISYQNQAIKFNGKEDLHEAFGVELSEPVNVGGYVANPLYSEEFKVDKYAFSMSTHASDFKIHVNYTDGSEGAEIGVPDRNGTIKEPQAFLIADPNWEWPLEQVCITNVYPEFGTWIANLKETGWCGTVWGKDDVVTNGKPSFSIIPDYEGDVKYNGNVATWTMNAAQMVSRTEYLIQLETSADAKVRFYTTDSTEVELTDVNVKAGELSTFTLSGLALEALRGGRMEITFPDGQNAEGRITKLKWIESGEQATNTALLDPQLTVESTSMTFTVGDPQQRINAESIPGHITYKSSNASVVTVSSDGNVSPVAEGTAYIAVTSVETVTYKESTVYVAVTVNANTANLQEPGLGFGSTLSLNANYTSQSENINTNSDGAITVTCSDNSVVNVVLNGKQMQITALKAGTATITVKQEATSTYAAAEKTMKVTVQASDPNLTVNDNLSWDATNNKTNSLSFNTQSDGVITIENSDASVVTAVVSGNQINFTALKAGTATITVKQAASAFYAEATKTVTVTVSGNFGDDNNGGSQGGSTELTGTPLTVTKDESQSVNGETWYKLSAADLYNAVGSNDANGVVLEFKLHNSGIENFSIKAGSQTLQLKSGSDFSTSVTVWGNINVTVQWNGEWGEVDGIPARTLIVTIPDKNYWVNGLVGYGYANDLYFGGVIGDQDDTIAATIRPNN